ncbi:MAG: 4Fe-4S dicluster domain-containing protein [Candidatus Nezhaarchaeales archaeon]
MPPKIDLEKCTGCGLCDKVCPGDVIYMDPSTKKPIVKYPDECWHCGSCRQECPAKAIKITFYPSMLI